MRPFAFLVAALTVVPGVLAVDQMKSVIIWTEAVTSTTEDLIKQAKQLIKDNGGKITHEYNFIHGFSAITPEKLTETVKGMSTDIKIEEDHEVSG